MESTTLYNECSQRVRQLAEQHSWQLNPTDREALVDAILPLVATFEAPTAAQIETIAFNYFNEAPTVQMMLGQEEPEGEALWVEWRTYFLNVAHSKKMPSDDAEDLVQKVFIETRRSLTNYRYQSALQTYLFRIFNNHFYKWLKKTKRAQFSDIDDETSTQPALDSESISEELMRNELRELMQFELQRMLQSVDFRILSLFYLEETFIDPQNGSVERWTDKKIGELLEMPLNTVTSRRTRAISRLRSSPKLAQFFADLMGE